jgi:hypothetical protein
MFGGLVWGYFRRRAGQRQAREDFPALAARLGISFRAPSNPNQIGKLSGTVRGRSVFVDPDEQRKIIVRFRGEPNVDLRNYDTGRRPPAMSSFSFGDRKLDSYFKTRYADPALIARLQLADWVRLMEPFTLRYVHEVKELNLTSHGVTCVLDFGSPRYIPGSAVEVLLPVMLDLADVVEESDGR